MQTLELGWCRRLLAWAAQIGLRLGCVVEVWALPAPLRGRLGCQSREGRLGSHARLGSGHLPLLSR